MYGWLMNVYGQDFWFNFIIVIIYAIVCTIDIWTGCSVVPTDLECIKLFSNVKCPSSSLKHKERNKHARKSKAGEMDIKWQINHMGCFKVIFKKVLEHWITKNGDDTKSNWDIVWWPPCLFRFGLVFGDAYQHG